MCKLHIYKDIMSNKREELAGELNELVQNNYLLKQIIQVKPFFVEK